MRIFIDACMDPRVREAFPGQEVSAAVDLGWHRLTDKVLVGLVQDHFDVLVTIDQGFEHQQNLSLLHFGIVIVHVERNRIDYYRPLFDEMRVAVAEATPGVVIHVRGVSI